jgi:hypothetical protein
VHAVAVAFMIVNSSEHCPKLLTIMKPARPTAENVPSAALRWLARPGCD